MLEKMNHISAEVWREWILQAISSIRKQKQAATFNRICGAIRKRHVFHEDTVAGRLKEAIESGAIRTIVRGDKTIYRVVKSSRAQSQHVQQADKLISLSNVLCIECLKTSLKGPDGHTPEPMSSCERCGISLHDSCANKLSGTGTALSLSQLVSSGNRWFCEECKSCDGCNTMDESISRTAQCLVVCASCSRKFHFQCMNPPVHSGERKFEQSWCCVKCIQYKRFNDSAEKIKQCHPTAFHQKHGEDRPKTGTRFIRAQPTEIELIDGRIEAMRLKLGDRVTEDDLDVFREVLRMRSNLEEENLKRTPEAIRLGRYVIETWYSSPFPQEYAKLKVLYMCEFCLKYMKTNDELDHHQRTCSLRHPPGWEIYRDGDISVFEVDGNDQRLYCQSLCLLAKLFLDHKTLYFDVEPFLFYILTIRDQLGHHLVGYFSKERYNQLNYNVSCILTMPQYQRQGYGRLLIDFSYMLSRVERKPGTPERPLSDLGRVSYQQYWCSVLLEYFYINRSESFTLGKASQETGMIVSDILTALRKLGFIRYRVERTGCIRTNRPFICIDWRRVEQHHQRAMTAKKGIELREICLRWIPNLRLSIVMKQFMHEMSNKRKEVISPVTMDQEPSKTNRSSGSHHSNEDEVRVVQNCKDDANVRTLSQLDTKTEQSSAEHHNTITSTGRTRFRSRKYSDTVYDLSLSLTTGTPKTHGRSQPQPNTVPAVKTSNLLTHSSTAAGHKLPFIVLVPLKIEPSERSLLLSSGTPSFDGEDISLDSVEAFMGTPKSELHKSSPEKHAGPGFTPIAPFRHQEDGDSRIMALVDTSDDACGRFCTPKTTRGRDVTGSFARRRKRIIGFELLSEETNPKRLRLDVTAGPDLRRSADDDLCRKDAAHDGIPVRRLDEERVNCHESMRCTRSNTASVDVVCAEPNKMLALFGKSLPRTI
ncbi:histone acetyltransferase KAT6B-like [Anopheles marshallii]|uniref:histone acetyltransferase KAT6B-like n=1 Tax=Anopheles marshallii TaxID=1521116 RepID=UPI00237BFD02|nr:histone acetyltransferase KAT6B-like [Anopheles marshallii]